MLESRFGFSNAVEISLKKFKKLINSILFSCKLVCLLSFYFKLNSRKTTIGKVFWTVVCLQL